MSVMNSRSEEGAVGRDEAFPREENAHWLTSNQGDTQYAIRRQEFALPIVSSSAVVGATAEEAFNFVADYRNIPRLQPQFSSATLVSEQARGLGAVVALDGRFHGVP